MKEIVEVALALPIQKTFYYLIPRSIKESLQTGMRVLVPFKGRKVVGFAIHLLDSPPKGLEEKLKEVEGVLDEAPLIDPQLLRFYRWVSEYYLYPLGEVIKTGLPPGLNLKIQMGLRLTEEGRKTLSVAEGDPTEKEILREIERRGKVSLKRMERLFSYRVSRSYFFSLKRKGLIHIEPELEEKEVKPKFEWIIRCEEGKQEKYLRKKEERIFSWIRERGEASYSEIKREFQSPLKSIQSLKEKGFVSITQREIFRDLTGKSDLKSYPKPQLTSDQETVFREILKGIQSRRYAPFLIHGVTGSGKTEVYLRAIEEILIQEREAIVLVPEISLTPQLLSRFRDRLGGNLALLHSGLSKRERYDQWRRIWKGEVKIVLGARSAIFAPLRRLGMIIVDEEHDPSYKQEEKLKYHARDLAVVRAKEANAVLLLGSATPSLESFFNVEKGKYQLLRLPERIEKKPLPKIEIVDMRREKGLLSEKLKEALKNNIADNKQSILFLNRRGFSNFVLCKDCGFSIKCPNCSVTLTYHLKDRSLRCHYCNFWAKAPGECPECRSPRLQGMGVGTERLEQEIKALFSGVSVGRMDRDTTSKKQAHQKILKGLESGEIRILIGTQMIVKGHDFPNITFVGVVSADTSLHFPDFRSSERTFQLLTQVAGRAGRGETFGEVVIQTFNPDHYSIQRAKEHDFFGFYEEESRFRKALNYPPFTRLINFRLIGNNEKKTELTAQEMGKLSMNLLKKDDFRKGVEVLGPSLAPFEKMRGKFRWQMMAKSKSPKLLHQFAKELRERLESYAKGRGVHLDIDVDPIFIL
ncbi:MAG: primosomal protein N' [Thermodesulfobacteriota bacterium]